MSSPPFTDDETLGLGFWLGAVVNVVSVINAVIVVKGDDSHSQPRGCCKIEFSLFMHRLI